MENRARQIYGKSKAALKNGSSSKNRLLSGHFGKPANFPFYALSIMLAVGQ